VFGDGLMNIDGCLQIEGEITVELREKDLDEEDERILVTFDDCPFEIDASQFRIFSNEGDCERSGRGEIRSLSSERNAVVMR